MPELPEVECIRRRLAPLLLGRCVADARLFRHDFCVSLNNRGLPRKTTSRDLLKGGVISSLDRRGKQLSIIAEDGRALCIHLGMSGQLLWIGTEARDAAAAPDAAEAKRSHVHARWTLRDRAGVPRGQLLFRDPRRFGGLWTFASVDEMCTRRWNSLGPDALAIREADLAAGLAGSGRAVKAALLDQSILAGVGNIYADEALFLARIHPSRAASELTDLDLQCLATAIRRTLQSAVERGGSTLRDFVDPNGSPGAYQNHHSVYGRGGKPCLRCDRVLKIAQIAQRTTVYCPFCQS